MTIEELKKIADDKYDEYREARQAYDNSLCEKFIEKYKGQFICFRQSLNAIPQYIYVYNIWNTTDDNGIFNRPVLIFEGVHFCGSISEYIDSTYFNWDQFQQLKLNLHDFDENTLEYKGCSKDNLMQIISREEYFKAFHSILNKVITEQEKFEYAPHE